MTMDATMTVCRNKDEKERRRVWEEMDGEVSSSAAGTSGKGGGLHESGDCYPVEKAEGEVIPWGQKQERELGGFVAKHQSCHSLTLKLVGAWCQ